MTTEAPSTFYGHGFAEFYDRYGTGWTRRFTPALAGWLDTQHVGHRSVLDLACGTGIATEILCDAGWQVTGIDVSAGMLATASRRLSAAIEAGTASLRQADMTSFTPTGQVSACVALEGALNHLPSPDALRQCFSHVATALAPSGTFVFDLYEPHHFRGWHHVSVIDEPDAVIVKRGVWDEAESVGMLRISGFFDNGSGPARVDQTVTSRVYPADTVDAMLSAAGFTPGRLPLPDTACACGRSASGSCRTVYLATKHRPALG